MWALRAQDGSPLPMAGYVCWLEELQGFRSVLDLHVDILLGLLCGDLDMALERSL